MRKNKNLCILFLIVLFCAAVFGGCGSSPETSGGKTTGESAQEAEEQNLGEFSMEDIKGELYTQEMFGEYDLTMVNVFTTWCTPCIKEIPDLEQLKHDMADQGVTVVGIILDAADASGNVDEDAVEQAKLLAERLGVTYPFLIPDEGYLNGRLAGINAVPETFFVDREGKLVGETYSGSRPLEDWKAIIEQELQEMGK